MKILGKEKRPRWRGLIQRHAIEIQPRGYTMVLMASRGHKYPDLSTFAGTRALTGESLSKRESSDKFLKPFGAIQDYHAGKWSMTKIAKS